jgi:hypothetical protein
MMLTAIRPPVNCPRAANWRAATHRRVKPGRWAVMNASRLVTGCGVAGRQSAFERRRMERHQRVVEAGRFVRLRH